MPKSGVRLLDVVVVAVAFALHAKILVEGLTNYSLSALFFLISENQFMCINSTLQPGSVHSGSVSCDNCGQTFPDELHVILFP